MSHFFIDRPVFAMVIALVIILLGSFAMLGLPVERYPNIAPPTINVSTVYPGADARTVAASGMSGANLCESWRKRLAGVVREPYLTVDCGESVLVPYGETRTLRYGATVAGDVLVASLADEIVLATVPTLGKCVLRGVGVGGTAVSFYGL